MTVGVPDDSGVNIAGSGDEISSQVGSETFSESIRAGNVVTEGFGCDSIDKGRHENTASIDRTNDTHGINDENFNTISVLESFNDTLSLVGPQQGCLDFQSLGDLVQVVVGTVLGNVDDSFKFTGASFVRVFEAENCGGSE